MIQVGDRHRRADHGQHEPPLEQEPTRVDETAGNGCVPSLSRPVEIDAQSAAARPDALPGGADRLEHYTFRLTAHRSVPARQREVLPDSSERAPAASYGRRRAWVKVSWAGTGNYAAAAASRRGIVTAGPALSRQLSPKPRGYVVLLGAPRLYTHWANLSPAPSTTLCSLRLAETWHESATTFPGLLPGAHCHGLRLRGARERSSATCKRTSISATSNSDC